MSGEEEPAERFGASYLAEWRSRRLDEAKTSYDRVLNRLWVSNGASAAASLTLLASSMKGGHAPHALLLLPLSLFLIGLLLLGSGDAMTLVVEARAIRDMESAESILELKVDQIKWPSQQAGLTLSDWRTRMAVCAAVALVLGVIAGISVLLCSFAFSSN